jgi:hypothetical protein
MRICRRLWCWSPIHRTRAGPGHFGAALVRSGYLSGQHAGVSHSEAVEIRFSLSTIRPEYRRHDASLVDLDGLNKLNEMTFRDVGDPETETRIRQYELAFRMQASVPS